MSRIPTDSRGAFRRYFVPTFLHCAGIASGLGVGLVFGIMLGVASAMLALSQ
jgi:hypothetical protein